MREEFAFLLKAAQTGSLLSEDHGYWIDFSSMYRARCVFMECGRRLADAGTLGDPQDVFYLTVDELLDIDGLTQQPALGRALVKERKAELDRCRRLNAPPVLGTDYGPPPDSPTNRFMAKFFGGPPPASDVPNVLKGNAGAPGKVTGTARVIRSLDDAGRLQRGDILVTDTTAPPWTPLFATAGGIVTDTGGILSPLRCRGARISHSCGRRHRAVQGVICDGALIEVDGDDGTIRMILKLPGSTIQVGAWERSIRSRNKPAGKLATLYSPR